MSQNKENQPPSINNPVPIDQSVQAQLDLLRADLNTLINTHVHDGLGATRVQLDDIMGLFETVSEVPTGVPKSTYDQVKLFVGGGIIVLYFYDTVSQVWRAIGVGVQTFAGKVDSNGDEGSPFPTGWTATYNGTGDYTVTHNLSNNDYAVTVSTDNENTVAAVDLRQSNTFDIKVTDLAGTPDDQGFFFIVALYP